MACGEPFSERNALSARPRYSESTPQSKGLPNGAIPSEKQTDTGPLPRRAWSPVKEGGYTRNEKPIGSLRSFLGIHGSHASFGKVAAHPFPVLSPAVF